MNCNTRVLTALAASFLISQSTLLAGTILGAPEGDQWSDMAFPGGISGGYDAGTLEFTVSAAPSNSLDIGAGTTADFGAGGSVGSAFGAQLSVSGVEINAAGDVTNGGSVQISYLGGAPGSIGDDYGVLPGGTLLEGFVTEVGLGATGAGTLDVAFEITGGVLQDGGTNGLGTLGVPFADSPAPSVPTGLLRIVGGIPADFSGNFSLSSSTINVFGIPEPTSALLMSVALGLLAARRTNR